VRQIDARTEPRLRGKRSTAEMPRPWNAGQAVTCRNTRGAAAW